MIYVPADLSIDSQWFFEMGQPVELELDLKNKVMVVKPISEKEALEKGWKQRQRSK
jgi:hypothetical protein